MKGRIVKTGRGKLSGQDVQVYECRDCKTVYTRVPCRALTINGHINDGFCPWCREDSKPWTRGRGK